jgi:hypothetical protein
VLDLLVGAGLHVLLELAALAVEEAAVGLLRACHQAVGALVLLVVVVDACGRV